MMFSSFKPNPKAQVVNKFNELFGREAKPRVEGYRSSYKSTYVTEVIVDDVVVATAQHNDWRKSYKLLLIEVEKLYADGISLI